MKVEVAVLGSPSLIVLMVSVDVKQHVKKEGRLALPVLVLAKNMVSKRVFL